MEAAFLLGWLIAAIIIIAVARIIAIHKGHDPTMFMVAAGLASFFGLIGGIPALIIMALIPSKKEEQ